MSNLVKQMKKLGYHYDFDKCGFFREVAVEIQDRHGTRKFNTLKNPDVRHFFPPFGITEEELKKRIDEKGV